MNTNPNCDPRKLSCFETLLQGRKPTDHHHGRIKRALRIDLPRPRTLDMLASEAYLALKHQVARDVHEEAQKAFERGERELA